MKLKPLGRTGVKVSELCLGTMTFGWKLSEEESHKAIDMFKEAGGNFIDTANVYQNGNSERIVGTWLKEHERDDLIIATKVRFRTGDGANDVGLSRKHILKSVEASLERLNTDYIDLLQVHAWDPLTPIGETLSVLDDLVRSGKVLYIGASNFRGWQLATAIDYSRHHKLKEFVSLQPQYNLLTRATEFELLPYCKREGISVIPWGPLKSGLLSGKYSREMPEPPEGSRLRRWKETGRIFPWNEDGNYVWNTLDALRRISSEIGRTPSQVALNWLLANPAVTAPIIGASNLEQLKDNIGSVDFALSKEQVNDLNNSSKLFVTYPYDADSDDQQQRGRES